MSSRFKGKTIWITGASSGIGKQLAIQLNALGANVIISARRVERLTYIDDHCPCRENMTVVPLDLTNHESVVNAVKKVESLGSLDLLIHNAGIAQKGLVIENEIAIDRQVMETNFFGTVDLTKEVMPIFLKQKKGWFAVVTSIAGVVGVPGRSGYSASKHALHGYFDSLRAELIDCDLNVTIIMPGFIKTNITKKELTGHGKAYGKLEKSHALGMDPDKAAKKIIKRLKPSRQNIIVGGFEVTSVYIQRIFPKLYNFIVRRHPMRWWRKVWGRK
ncbi:SDR family oxidoreductase [Paracrocinitomix mangrovi]|uniref:SDR family oxidoreductase n=1 Tax=Paracrocinitomix mangrovi TaxID=2862509 RepID=UPI001C8ED9B0|nr:SDR family oxidoreductase [Paracrocinitomix mangrovi]UKN02571.1 SDR family oxidoreductase [Paracrocinitomix mangrovi]